MDSSPIALSGLSCGELTALLGTATATETALPSFRAKQIFRWIRNGAHSFDEMTDLPLDLRSDLTGRFSVYTSAVSLRLDDPDGTVKLQLRLHDGAKIESVLLSDGEGRRTACLSTQAGCAMGCVFCKTGTLGLKRNLNSAEITEQFFHLRSLYPDIANIVIMGMGEPLLNLGELRRALAVFTDSVGQSIGLSARRITVSTCGIIDGIRDLADNGPPLHLAVSLTSADSALRERLMPVSRANPLSGLKQALSYYQKKTGERLTLEAVLLGGINTRYENARSLARFASGLNAMVNVIPWNPVEGLMFEGNALTEPSTAETARFTADLEKFGVKVTRRLKKGRAVTGACGQLG
ncbi:putative dual-specificity RNA methyltransferase RlmN [Spirochaetia bacterium]|nr:putative dual-specificity RNA methyltransferase RlmN [Spirochaetia bacterium]